MPCAMFDNLFDFSKQRSAKQAFGFYAFYATIGLVLTVLLA